MASLEIRKLEKSYGATKVLRGVSLGIEAGQFISLLGPSGSGKTTILRCLAGLERPDATSGEIILNGKALSGPSGFTPPEKRRLGMVFQNYAVWPHMDVFENVAFPLRIQARNKEIPASDIDKKVKSALALVKLDSLSGRFAHQLSGGQQQRVALARALAMSPQLLLLDEPLSNLDALLRDELGAEIRRLQQELRLTTILVTHDQKEALSLSDRIVVLNQGQIEADGAPESLYAQPPTPFVAEFLSGAQTLKMSSGESRTFLPRKWSERASGPGFEVGGQVISRIYLGSEYQYWAKVAETSEPLRFFSARRMEVGDAVRLRYAP